MLCLAVTLTWVVGIAFGQADSGTISGIVTDISGASIADVRVEILRTESNDIICLLTDEQGLFSALNLPMGDYQVTVLRDGFQSKRMTGIVLQSQTPVRADQSGSCQERDDSSGALQCPDQGDPNSHRSKAWYLHWQLVPR